MSWLRNIRKSDLEEPANTYLGNNWQ